MPPEADHPPIEVVATRIRDLRRTARVLSSSPDVVGHVDAELRRVAADYDGWLVVAAHQVGVECFTIENDGTGLPADVRRQIERSLSRAGWLLDG